MTEKPEAPGGGIPKRFRDLTADVRLERLVRYVVRQLALGRHFDDVLSDPYVVTHSTDTTRSELLQHPEVIEALEAGLRRTFADYTGSVGHSPPEEPATPPQRAETSEESDP